ncbi:unnamed protein product [Blepharisma stoltei]|uniref:Lsm14-like N-terminal domain-containing protein n=1 Tax=Blepharisma stoltei TaxID=1481888 RepID=A0AAU9JC16_9CILI|nr:unnamed protein product [Blepharisma stoltei]
MIRSSVLGRTIEITTFRGIRYSGTIIQVNPRSLYVTLSKVRRIGKRETFYDFFVFRATDIQNLYFDEDPAIICRGPKVNKLIDAN